MQGSWRPTCWQRGFCLPMLPKADAYGGKRGAAQKGKARNIPANGNGVRRFHLPGSLRLCDFFRVAAGVLLSVAPLPDSAAACVSAACEITAGCAAFAALWRQGGAIRHLSGDEPAGILCMGPAAAVAARPGADADACYKPPAACCPLSPAGAPAALGAAAGADRVQHAGPAGRTNVPPAAGCRCGGGGVFLHTALQRLQKTFIIQYKYNFAR